MDQNYPSFVTTNLYQDALVEIKDTSRHIHPYHRHNGYELYLFLEGHINFYIGKECYSPEPGTLFLIHANEYHQVHSLDHTIPYRRVCVYFLPHYLNLLSSSSTDLSQCFNPSRSISMITLNAAEQKHFVTLATQLQHCLESQGYGDDLKCRIFSTELMLFVNQKCMLALPDRKEPLPRLVVETISYVDQHLIEDFSIDQLAKDLYHNRSYISRIFREHVGITLQQYIINQRIRLARQLLENGESIAETCYKSGFRNYSNFIRTFTKNTGMPPLHYQREAARLLQKNDI